MAAGNLNLMRGLRVNGRHLQTLLGYFCFTASFNLLFQPFLYCNKALVGNGWAV